MRKNIYFHFEDIAVFPLPGYIESWIKDVILHEKFILYEVNVIFSSDRFLLSLNNKHLAHNYYTDIITFDYRTEPKKIHGDLFISKERVIENSITFKVSVNHELLRIIAHGLLHLFGYTDKSEKDKKLMRSMEDLFISLYRKEYVSRGTI